MRSGESFLRVHWVAVPKELRARRVNRGIYSPGVLCFRSSEATGYEFLPSPLPLSFVAVAAIDRPTLNDGGRLKPSDASKTKRKIAAALSIGLEHGHDCIVLSAFGCGAFQNPPEHVAQIFRELLTGRDEGSGFGGFPLSFRHRYKRVVFAILEDHNSMRSHNRDGNLAPFRRQFPARTGSQAAAGRQGGGVLAVAAARPSRLREEEEEEEVVVVVDAMADGSDGGGGNVTAGTAARGSDAGVMMTGGAIGAGAGAGAGGGGVAERARTRDGGYDGRGGGGGAPPLGPPRGVEPSPESQAQWERSKTVAAGLLMYRWGGGGGADAGRGDGGEVEVLLAHMGGAMWARRQRSWSIPKGGPDDAAEAAFACAQREFWEETHAPTPADAGAYVDLGHVRQGAGKLVLAWGVADVGGRAADPAALYSNTFTDRAGREVPEMDRFEWVGARTALDGRMVEAQEELVRRLLQRVRRRRPPPPAYLSSPAPPPLPQPARPEPPPPSSAVSPPWPSAAHLLPAAGTGAVRSTENDGGCAPAAAAAAAAAGSRRMNSQEPPPPTHAPSALAGPERGAAAAPGRTQPRAQQGQAKAKSRAGRTMTLDDMWFKHATKPPPQAVTAAPIIGGQRPCVSAQVVRGGGGAAGCSDGDGDDGAAGHGGFPRRPLLLPADDLRSHFQVKHTTVPMRGLGTRSDGWAIAEGELGVWTTQPPLAPMLSAGRPQAVAAFDFDMTLANCDNFRGGVHDWKFRHDKSNQDLGVKRALRWLHAQGYLIAVLSNNSLGSLVNFTPIRKSLCRKFGRIENLAAEVGVPMIGLVGLVSAKRGGRFHKPNTVSVVAMLPASARCQCSCARSRLVAAVGRSSHALILIGELGVARVGV
jgi:predicted NUDIX family NTP pyrophosphohydrolase